MAPERVFGQSAGSEAGQGRTHETRREAGQEVSKPAPRPASDIVSDNLDRVAANADQILELLNRDAGLLVEFKRLLAQDAGANGQLLEESDLLDTAVTERLKEDLHTRVLATRLLRRYGYLLPKVNPDSDLAAEHNLVLQDRAYAMTHAAERYDNARTYPPVERTSVCDPRQSMDCDFDGREPGRTFTPSTIGNPEYRSPGQSSPYENYPGTLPRNDTNQPSRELRTEFPSTDGGETLLVSQPQTGAGETATNSSAKREAPLNESAPLASSNEYASSTGISPAFPDSGLTSRVSRGNSERRIPNTSSLDSAASSLDSVRMVHKPNPYAGAPSLYDLYVQASASSPQLARFGLDVFRRGAENTGALPMDLPVGPDYVVGPGDGLSIDLWGGVSQRLFRTVDREGRLLLPEAGPLLVSGKSLGEVQESVQRVLRTQFRDVSADISLLRLRTVRVYVVGEVAAPGAYDVSSLSTPLNALFAAGGVTPRGSLRHLEHYRGKTLLEEVDTYELLLHGIRGNLQRLENGDSLRVLPLGPNVTVEGMVRRPAIYELHGEKNLEEVLELAGGILPAAALRKIEVQRIEAH